MRVTCPYMLHDKLNMQRWGRERERREFTEKRRMNCQKEKQILFPYVARCHKKHDVTMRNEFSNDVIDFWSKFLPRLYNVTKYFGTLPQGSISTEFATDCYCAFVSKISVLAFASWYAHQTNHFDFIQHRHPEEVMHFHMVSFWKNFTSAFWGWSWVL